MADIFISYSKAYRAQTEQLAQALQQRGFTVWWDTSLVPGDSFKDVIVAELARAQAAIVIWTPDSVRSDWVYSEASRARARRMLIPVRDDKIAVVDIPPPFDALHTDLQSNIAGIEAALAKLGVKPQAPQPQDAAPSGRGGLSEASVAEALALEHWQAIKQAADPQKLREFLAEFGASKSAKLARDRLAELEAQAWARLPKRRTAAQLRAFLADFPEGAKADAAEAELAALRRAEAQQSFASAKRAGTVAALDKFIAAYPEGELTAQAQALRADVMARAAARRLAQESNISVEPPRRWWLNPKFAVASVIVIGLGLPLTWQWPEIAGLYQAPPTPVAAGTATDTSMVAKNSAAATPNAATPAKDSTQFVPELASADGAQATLYEEDPADPAGHHTAGTATWRTVTAPPAAGQPPDVAVEAKIDIPERGLSVTWTLRRNTDASLPASHTIEIMFKLPADLHGGGIQNVPGVLMKTAEQARGTPLAGIAVKVTTGFFLIGLSATAADRDNNIKLLKERLWFDIPIVYTDGKRAIIAVEKSAAGESAFARAFKEWDGVASAAKQ